MRFFLTTMLVAGLQMSAPAGAAVIEDRATFEGLLGNQIFDDYENPGYAFLQTDAVMSAVVGETRYMSTGFFDTSVVDSIGDGNHYYCAGCNGTFRLDFTNTSVTTGSGVFGVGFEFFNADFNDPRLLYNAFVSYGDGSTENFVLGEALLPPTKFFGVVSEALIATIDFGLANGGTTQEGAFGIDNLTIGNAATTVPEPGTLSLLGVGLVGLLLSRRRQDKAGPHQA